MPGYAETLLGGYRDLAGQTTQQRRLQDEEVQQDFGRRLAAENLKRQYEAMDQAARQRDLQAQQRADQQGVQRQRYESEASHRRELERVANERLKLADEAGSMEPGLDAQGNPVMLDRRRNKMYPLGSGRSEVVNPAVAPVAAPQPQGSTAASNLDTFAAPDQSIPGRRLSQPNVAQAPGAPSPIPPRPAFTPMKSAIKLDIAGGRESVYAQRMIMAANQAAKDLDNVVQLPLSSSTGWLGGRKQGPGLMDATMEVLANKATPLEAQAYTAMATGFQRALAQIETAGLAVPGSLTHQMDAVIFKEGEPNLIKLHKLAQTRQIVEAGMETVATNPRISQPEKDKVNEILGKVKKAVPFTHSDLIELQKRGAINPNATLKDVVGARDNPSGWNDAKEQRYQDLLKKRGGT